jgi:hypothetical protein
MSRQMKIPSREDILRMVQAELHAQLREDVQVRVAFVVNLDAGDPVIVNTILDPHEPFPRWKCKQFVKSILERIAEMEKAQLKATDMPPAASGPLSASPEIADETTQDQTLLAGPVVL